MKDRYKPILRAGHLLAAIFFLCIAAAKSACADVVGRLHFSVKNAADEKPLANAKIVLKDSAKVRPDVTLTTDAKGSATSPPLDAHAWQAITDGAKADEFQTDTRAVTVAADTTTEVEVLLEPLKEKVFTTKTNKDLVSKNTSSGNTQTSDQIKEFPSATNGNTQQLQGFLLTNPGMVQDSVGQVHPRGEHSSTTLFIDGFQLPDVLMGRAGALLVPDTFQSIDVMTGGYAPEYGGETAAILNINLKSGPIKPLELYSLQGGSFNTWQGSMTFGGQAGRAIGQKDADGNAPRAFGYAQVDVFAERPL